MSAADAEAVLDPKIRCVHTSASGSEEEVVVMSEGPKSVEGPTCGCSVKETNSCNIFETYPTTD